MSKKVKLISFEKLMELLEEQKPFVSFAKSVADKVDDIDLFDFLCVVEEQVDCVTDEDVFCWLIDNYYINEHGEANKKYIDKGYFSTRTEKVRVFESVEIVTKTFVTGLGQIYFTEKIKSDFTK